MSCKIHTVNIHTHLQLVAIYNLYLEHILHNIEYLTTEPNLLNLFFKYTGTSTEKINRSQSPAHIQRSYNILYDRVRINSAWSEMWKTKWEDKKKNTKFSRRADFIRCRRHLLYGFYFIINFAFFRFKRFFWTRSAKNKSFHRALYITSLYTRIIRYMFCTMMSLKNCSCKVCNTLGIKICVYACRLHV